MELDFEENSVGSAYAELDLDHDEIDDEMDLEDTLITTLEPALKMTLLVILRLLIII